MLKYIIKNHNDTSRPFKSVCICCLWHNIHYISISLCTIGERFSWHGLHIAVFSSSMNTFFIERSHIQIFLAYSTYCLCSNFIKPLFTISCVVYVTAVLFFKHSLFYYPLPRPRAKWSCTFSFFHRLKTTEAA